MVQSVTYGAVTGSSVVSLAIAKKNSNIESDHEDDLLQIILDAAVEDVENYLETPVVARPASFSIAQWPTVLELPIAKVQSIASVTYLDVDGVVQTVIPTDYVLLPNSTGAKLEFVWQEAPELTTNIATPITINMVAGYADGEVSPTIKSAVLMRFSHKERFREDVPTNLDRMFHAVLMPLKTFKDG